MAYTEVWGRRVLRVRGRHAFRHGGRPGPERRFDTFVTADRPVRETVELLLLADGLNIHETAHPVLAAISTVDALEHVEGRTLHPCLDGQPGVSISLVAPGAGLIEGIRVDGTDIAAQVVRIARERLEDAEGRETPTLCAMAMGLAADDADDLDRIVDTVFACGTVRYRGVRSHLKGQDLVVAEHRIDEVTVGEHGIDLKGLADTIRNAIHGRALERQPLSALVDMPGFGDLRIRQITRHGGQDNLRVVIADDRMADLPRVDREGARLVAGRILAARRS